MLQFFIELKLIKTIFSFEHELDLIKILNTYTIAAAFLWPAIMLL